MNAKIAMIELKEITVIFQVFAKNVKMAIIQNIAMLHVSQIVKG